MIIRIRSPDKLLEENVRQSFKVYNPKFSIWTHQSGGKMDLGYNGDFTFSLKKKSSILPIQILVYAGGGLRYFNTPELCWMGFHESEVRLAWERFIKKYSSQLQILLDCDANGVWSEIGGVRVQEKLKEQCSEEMGRRAINDTLVGVAGGTIDFIETVKTQRAFESKLQIKPGPENTVKLLMSEQRQSVSKGIIVALAEKCPWQEYALTLGQYSDFN